MVDDVLTKVDRATMSASLEGREPLLDHRIIEFVAQLPSDYKYSGRNGKRMLKDLVHKYIPNKLMDRPKMGFGIPIDNWLKNDFKDMVIDLTNEDFLKNQNIFNSNKIINYRDSFLMEDLTDQQSKFGL